MAQEDILNFLETNSGKLFNAHEFSDAIGLNYNSVCNNLKRMIKKPQLIEYKLSEFCENNRYKRHRLYWVE